MQDDTINQETNLADYSYLLEEADKYKTAGEYQKAIQTCEKVLFQDLEVDKILKNPVKEHPYQR